jgi:hypothetical protein
LAEVASTCGQISIDATRYEENIAELAVAGGLDPERVLPEVSERTDDYIGPFTRVAENLALSEVEMLELAWAYAMERWRPPR